MSSEVVFKYLFSPLEKGKLRLKNRIVMLAATLEYAKDGEIDDRTIEFVAARARGGAGLIIPGAFAIDEYGGGEGLLRIDDDRFVPGMAKLARIVHEADCKIAAQLAHQGRYVRSEHIGGRQPLSASALAPAHFGRGVPKEMTKQDIETTIDHFARAAGRAKAAGFDAVELLGSQGYLINQFLSPVSNKRADEYGGSFENRLRFPLEIVAAVRRQVGDAFPIIMRLCASEFVPGGLGIEDTKKVARAYEQAGIDMLDLQIAWHESTVPSVYMVVPRGAFTYLARAIKQAVGIPVVAVNRINDVFLAEEILRQGKADLVGMARALIADPELPNKAREGRIEDICPCVGCLEGCLAFSDGRRLPVKCLTNPRAGREAEFPRQAAPERKKVVVVGGGPAGLESARVLSARGHRVVLFEKEPVLGGELRLAGLIPDKQEFSPYISYLERQLQTLRVKLFLGKEATPQAVLDEKPQAVVIATGAHATMPPIPGINDPRVIGYRDVLNGRELGEKVVVIGAGGVGCDMAIYAARLGAPDAESLLFLLRAGAINGEEAVQLSRGGRKVTLLEMLDKIGLGIYPQVRWVVLQELRRLGVEAITGIKCQQITDRGVLISHQGQEKLIEADSVIIAAGIKPENSLYQAVKEKVPETYLVGNAGQVRDALAATEEAATIAYKI
ncbi:MAG: FAD-dependent oxidoreductase [Chloroflexota bacterium]